MTFKKFKIVTIRKRSTGFVVFVCANSPFKHEYEAPHPLAGQTVLTNDCITEKECHGQIDLLIHDLEQLKVKVSQLFAKPSGKS